MRSANVVVIFRARPGRGLALVAELRRIHQRLPSFVGFVAIELVVPIDDPERVIELEIWRSHDDHRAFAEAFDAEGGFDALMACVEGEPEVLYVRTPS